MCVSVRALFASSLLPFARRRVPAQTLATSSRKWLVSGGRGKCDRPENPVVVGGLMAAEEGMAMVRSRAKRHRWHPKTLKSYDPLVVSAGWRRFQTQPVYAIEDPNERQR